MRTSAIRCETLLRHKGKYSKRAKTSKVDLVHIVAEEARLSLERDASASSDAF